MSQWGEPRIFAGYMVYPTNPPRHAGTEYVRVIPLIAAPPFEPVTLDDPVDLVVVLDQFTTDSIAAKLKAKAEEFIGKPYREWLARPNDELKPPIFTPLEPAERPS